jgi:endonuclease YncB( thermonuclease family)
MEGTQEMTQHPLPRYERTLLPISALLIGISVVAASPPATTLTGKVVKIADGDTLTLRVDKTQVKVRLEGIDTPERGQPFGRKAGQALARKVFGKAVQVDDLGKDRYGRTLGIVRLGTRNVNVELVRERCPCGAAEKKIRHQLAVVVCCPSSSLWRPMLGRDSC